MGRCRCPWDSISVENRLSPEVSPRYVRGLQDIRPRAIREALQNKHLIQTDAKTGATTLVDVHRLPPLPPELKPLLPLILKAADNLDRLQRRALEDAEAAKVAFTYDEVSKEFTAMSVA